MKSKSLRGIVKLFLAISLLVIVLCGCNTENEAKRTTQIPEDGIIDHTVFETIKTNGDIGIFNGNSNDITYQWLFMGSLMDSPKDENLLVNFSSAKTEEVKQQISAQYVQELSFAADEIPDSGPTLSVYFAYPWDVDSVEVYKYDAENKAAVPIATAALENSPNAIVTYIPEDYKGLFYLVGKTTDLSGEKMQQTPGSDSSQEQQKNTGQDDYVTNEGAASGGAQKDNNAASGGTQKDGYVIDKGSGMEIDPNTGKDKYLTDPVPAGKPAPVEPEDVTVDKNKKCTATLSIRCDTILDNMDIFNQDKLSVLPSDGVIMNTRTVVFYDGESVFDVLKREVTASKIHMEFVFTPMYNSVYVEGIHNLYEFDCGALSGWMYKVNGWFPNYGASRYVLKNGDVIEWVYTCDLGKDVGGYYAIGGK